MARAHSTIDVFAVGFDRQREWIEGRGLLLLLAIYLGGVGGGLFLASAIVGWEAGLAVALGIAGIGKGGAHLLFLGRPLRFWQAFRRPHSSWISRGIYILVLFLALGLAYYFSFDKGNDTLRVVSGVFAAGLITYTGFLMAASPGISFWHNPLLPLVFASAALSSGVALAAAVSALRPETAMLHGDRLEPVGLFLVTSVVVVLFLYLATSYLSSLAARESVTYLTRGRFASVFYAGVVVLGILVPLAILVPAYMDDIPRGWLAAAGISELGGSFLLRYSLLKAGIYPPVL